MSAAAAEIIPFGVKEMPPAPQRLAEFLRAKHPRDTAAHVGRDLAALKSEPGADLIKSWIAGRGFPTRSGHLDALIAAYGQEIVLALWGPVLITPEQQLEREAEELRAAADAKIAERDRVRQHRRKFLGLR